MRNFRDFPIPMTKEPYVNTLLYPAGYEKDTGLQRFWISSWNSNVGSTGLLVNENGKEKTFRFKRDSSSGLAKCGFYSACYAGNDVMWLCGDLAQVFRLDFATGEMKGFLTGAPSLLVFTGMIYDEKTGKLCFSAYRNGGEITVSFDTRAEKTARIYENVKYATTSRGSVKNADGTYFVEYEVMGHGKVTLMKWDPSAETLEAGPDIDMNIPGRRIYDDQGRIFVKEDKWYDPVSQSICSGIAAPRTASWFARVGDTAYGTASYGQRTEIVTWNMKTGESAKLCEAENLHGQYMCVTEKKEIVGVTTFGDFYKFSLDGKLLDFHELDSRSYGSLDCLVITTKDLLMGTPFITQRFWVADTETGKGYDAGKAADGGGEVLQTEEIGGKVYMASYTQGELTEYDPTLPGSFPVNPKVVARPKKSLRPVCHATDGVNFYYVSSHHYGYSGAEATRYNTKTGEVFTCDDPVPGCQIKSLFYNKKHDLLVGGTTYATDCDIGKRTASVSSAVALSPETLMPLAIADAPEGVLYVTVLGAISDDGYLAFFGNAGDTRIISLTDVKTAGKLSAVPAKKLMEAGFPRGSVIWAGKNGYFVFLSGGEVSLYFCDGEKWEKKKTFFTNPEYKRVFVSDGCVLAVTATTVDCAEIFG